MRWALVGASTIAAAHTPGTLRLADQNVVMVPGHTARQAGKSGRKRGTAGSGTGLDAIPLQDRIEAVHISSTNEKHDAEAMAAIASGTHVPCENPLAMVAGLEGYTRPFSGSGLEVQGTEGSIFATGAMTRQPVREVVQVAAAGREAARTGRRLMVQDGEAA